jgi:hypothetical protein
MRTSVDTLLLSAGGGLMLEQQALSHQAALRVMYVPTFSVALLLIMVL